MCIAKVSLKNSSTEEALGYISFPSEAGELELPHSKVPGCLLCITTPGLHRDGKGKGWGWSTAQLPRLLPACLRHSTAPSWRQSLVKDSACFLWCYLRICHSPWERGPARSDGSFGVLIPHVYVIEKRKNKFSCFISPQRALHASEAAGRAGLCSPLERLQKKTSAHQQFQLQP